MRGKRIIFANIFINCDNIINTLQEAVQVAQCSSAMVGIVFNNPGSVMVTMTVLMDWMSRTVVSAWGNVLHPCVHFLHQLS